MRTPNVAKPLVWRYGRLLQEMIIASIPRVPPRSSSSDLSTPPFRLILPPARTIGIAAVTPFRENHQLFERGVPPLTPSVLFPRASNYPLRKYRPVFRSETFPYVIIGFVSLVVLTQLSIQTRVAWGWISIKRRWLRGGWEADSGDLLLLEIAIGNAKIMNDSLSRMTRRARIFAFTFSLLNEISINFTSLAKHRHIWKIIVNWKICFRKTESSNVAVPWLQRFDGSVQSEIERRFCEAGT